MMILLGHHRNNTRTGSFQGSARLPYPPKTLSNNAIGEPPQHHVEDHFRRGKPGPWKIHPYPKPPQEALHWMLPWPQGRYSLKLTFFAPEK